VWEGSAFVQDNVRIGQALTLQAGLRYERLGQFGDQLGRNSSFDVRRAETNPPPDGSLAGYIVASNFPGIAPPGVLQAENTFGNYGVGQDTIAPRIGLAWQVLPNASRLVLRAGYGIYYSRPTAHAFTVSVLGAPFAQFRLATGLANAGATFQAPFQQPFPTPASFPAFATYAPGGATIINTAAPEFRPARVHQFSLNLQAELHEGWLLQAAYVGTRGSHLQRYRSLNQALDAPAGDSVSPFAGTPPITLADIPLRVPIPGIPADSLRQLETEGRSWYNGLEVGLTKQLSRGLQFLASYTFSKTLDTDGADINGTSSANALTRGDQNSPRQRVGRASFDRTHRFIFSMTAALPGPTHGLQRAFLGGWSVSAVATIQSGTAQTIGYTNSTNLFGISQDRAQLTGTCGKSQLVNAGPVGSKLNGYFNASCFTTPPVIGTDGIGTAFGNSGTGILDGPGQRNVDLALSKTVALEWPTEESTAELRAEFFNAFNHPQFADPDTNFSSPTFGVIGSTSVNERVAQLALRLNF
jgi:hypothetical protein